MLLHYQRGPLGCLNAGAPPQKLAMAITPSVTAARSTFCMAVGTALAAVILLILLNSFADIDNA